MDAGELATRRLEVAFDPGADRDHDRVMGGGQLGRVDRAADVATELELDALRLEQRDAPVDHPLLELRVRHPEAHQPARCLVALVDGHVVADLVELGRRGEARWAGADHGEPLAGAALGRAGDDPALLEAAIDDRVLDLLDHHRVVVDREHARRFARRRADQPGELGEIVGGVQLLARLLPVVAADEVVPVRDQVAERAGRVAERHAAVHAAGPLELQLVGGEDAEDLPVVGDSFGRVALGVRDPAPLHERARIPAHMRSALASLTLRAS